MSKLKPEGPDTVYYLNSILRQLRDWQGIVTTSESFYGPTISTEVLADNIDWLDCHIDSLKPHEEEKAKVIAWANRSVDSVKDRMWDLEDALTGMCDAYVALLLMKAEDPSRFQEPGSPYAKAKALLPKRENAS